MLRNLLAERFHLKARLETREFPALALVIARSGTKLGTEAATRAASEEGFPELSRGRPDFTASNSVSGVRMLTRVRARQQPVSILAKSLRTGDQRPVVDQTGLSGKYDFALEFSTDISNTSPGVETERAGAPDLRTALREQLGLQLVPKKLALKVVIIESFDRFPTEN